LQAGLTKFPGDPRVTLPLAQTRVGLAMLLHDAGEREAARELLDRSLPELETLRAAAHADRWDEALHREGMALRTR
jgi:hypothetical protein